MIDIDVEIIFNKKQNGGLWAGVSVKHPPIEVKCDKTALDWASGQKNCIEGQVLVYNDDQFMLRAQFIDFIVTDVALKTSHLLGLQPCDGTMLKRLIKTTILDNNYISSYEPVKGEWIVW